ncbi:MAG: TetR/AcrR family transcriptional regulator, partial [Muribaculaceae bacterium]|nr:TetR/AcrR family transcriptional regulator [Muribaculaceae bacterium]
MTPLPRSEHNRLLAAIYPIIREHGLKGATMDMVARRLGMSKRTLYEIFQNKSAMIIEVLE